MQRDDETSEDGTCVASLTRTDISCLDKLTVRALPSGFSASASERPRRPCFDREVPDVNSAFTGSGCSFSF